MHNTIHKTKSRTIDILGVIYVIMVRIIQQPQVYTYVSQVIQEKRFNKNALYLIFGCIAVLICENDSFLYILYSAVNLVNTK